MALQFELVFTEKNITHVSIKNDKTQTNDQIEVANDGTFTYENVQYIIFECLLSLRKHQSTFEYEDKGVPEYAVIPMTSAEKFLTWMATIHERSLIYANVQALPSINDALKAITEELKSQVTDMASDNDLRHMFDIFLNLLNNLITEITPQQMRAIYQYSDIVRLMIPDSLPVSEVLKVSGQYLYDLLTYDPKMCERLSLTYPMQMLSYVLRIFLLLFSQFNLPFTDREGILIHEVTAIMIDLLSDRLTTFVYLNDGNAFASGIIQQITRKYPSLVNVRDLDKIGIFIHNNRDFENFIRDSYPDFNLWPFILAIHMPIQQRITFNIKTCLDNMNHRHSERLDIQPSEVIQLIYDICKLYVKTNRFERYNESCFKQIISSSLFTKMSEIDAHPENMEYDENNSNTVESFKLSDVWEAIHKKILHEKNNNKKNDDGDDYTANNEFHFNRMVSQCSYQVDNKSFTIIRENFDVYLNIFLAYIRTNEPRANLEGSLILGHFLRTLFKLIIIVTHDEDSMNVKLKGIDNLNNMTICYSLLYKECRDLFNLTSKFSEKKLEGIEWALDRWGKNYWNFLHSLSILVQFTHERYPNRLAMDYYAAIMLNIDIILPCSICVQNYQDKKPLLSTSLPIIFSQDAIRVTYDLHNSVRITNNNDIYDFMDFLKDWGLKVNEIKSIEINSVYIFDIENENLS